MSGALMGMIAGNKSMLDAIYKAIGRRVIQSWGSSAELGGCKPDLTQHLFSTLDDRSHYENDGVVHIDNQAECSSSFNSELFDLTNVDEVKINLGIRGLSTGGYFKLELFDEANVFVGEIYSKTGFHDTGSTYTPYTGMIDTSLLAGNYYIKCSHQDSSTWYVDVYIYDVEFDGVGQNVDCYDLVGDSLLMKLNRTSQVIYSPVFAPSDLGSWDMATFSIDNKLGNIQVDVLDGSNDSVLKTDIKSGEMIDDLTVLSLRLKFTFTKATLIAESPVLYNFAFMYLA